jgi:hypothetical protein
VKERERKGSAGHTKRAGACASFCASRGGGDLLSKKQVGSAVERALRLQNARIRVPDASDAVERQCKGAVKRDPQVLRRPSS